MDLTGVAAVFILPKHGFSDHVFNTVSRVLANQRTRITVASLHGDPVESTRSITVLPDTAVNELSVDTVDAVILVGGPDATPLLEHEHVYNVVDAAVEHGLVVGAVGATPLVLAKLSVLDGRTVAGHETVVEKAGEYGFTAADERVAVDNRVVTAAADQAQLFGEEITALLQKREQE